MNKHRPKPRKASIKDKNSYIALIKHQVCYLYNITFIFHDIDFYKGKDDVASHG